MAGSMRRRSPASPHAMYATTEFLRYSTLRFAEGPGGGEAPGVARGCACPGVDDDVVAAGVAGAGPEPEAEALLAQMRFTRFNARTLTTPAAFRKELARTRLQGYGVDEGEEREGAHCIGAVILNRQKLPAGAIWLTGPSSRVPASDFPRLGQRLREAARQISARLGHYEV